MSDIDEFDLDTVDRRLPDAVRLAVADITLSWASLETTITYWFARAFGLPADAASIVLGPMAAKAKIDKLRMLHRHVGMEGRAKAIDRMARMIETHGKARNSLAHKRCIGVLRAEPSTIVLNSLTHVKGRVGHIEVETITSLRMQLSTRFALRAETAVRDMASQLQEPLLGRP